MQRIGNNTEGGYHAIYLMDFYVGGHHIFKVGLSANPHSRNKEIATSLLNNNKHNIDVPLYRFIHNVIHWRFKSVWVGDAHRIEELLLDRLKLYSDSLHTDNTSGGRVWNKFSGMYEAYPIRSKHTHWITTELERIMEKEIVGNDLYKGKVRYDGNVSCTFTERK